jgi:hypothetical protein
LERNGYIREGVGDKEKEMEEEIKIRRNNSDRQGRKQH